MHGPINVKSPNNTSKWQMGFNSTFKGLIMLHVLCPTKAKNKFEIREKNIQNASYKN
jgi:hypothetical protein